jgi:hypothetical protein
MSDAARYSFIVMDLHLRLFADLIGAPEIKNSETN